MTIRDEHPLITVFKERFLPYAAKAAEMNGLTSNMENAQELFENALSHSLLELQEGIPLCNPVGEDGKTLTIPIGQTTPTESVHHYTPVIDINLQVSYWLDKGIYTTIQECDERLKQLGWDQELGIFVRAK